jgi:hypothetical protein
MVNDKKEYNMHKQYVMPTFKDKDNNVFVFSSWAFPIETWDEEKDNVSNHAFMLRMAMGIVMLDEPTIISVNEENNMIENFPHLKADLTHPSLEHGGEFVYIISGPKYDEAYFIQENNNV